jgi:hypothetical protein
MFRLAPIRRILSLAVMAVLSCNIASAQQAPPPLLQQDTKPAKKCKPKDTACKSAQDSSQNSTSSDSSSSSSSQPQSLHDQFPFPTDDSRHGGDAEGTTPAPSAPPANPNGLPAMPTTPTPDPPAESEKPMNLPRDSSGSLPPGTSSSSSSDDDDVAPTTEAPNAPVKAAPLKNYGAKDSDEVIREKLDKTRLPDDLKVGRYYLDSGNNQGAYLRFKDAVSLDSEDPDARFYLAEAASKLNHRDEAIANYQECLKLDPGGDHDKAARRALAKFGVTAKK